MYYGSMGPLDVLASGAADAGFTATAATASLGDNPLAIAADTTLQILDPATPGDEPAAGTAYMIASDSGIYIWESGGTWATQLDSLGDPLASVTGLSVAAGTTLTLELNYTTYARIDLSNDIDNAGTITTADASATQRGPLDMYMASYIGSGAIDTSGSADGQAGGDIDFYSDYSFISSGTINSAGADSATADAGGGGDVYISVDYNIENTGTITTSGGAATGSAGNGGSAGYIELYAYYAVKNSGDLTASGGDGIDATGSGSGGSGGDFEIEADYDDYPMGQRVALLGYEDGITTGGGDGNYGGDAGDVDLYCDYGYSDTGIYTPGCNITNEVAITGRGGNVVTGATTTPADGGDGASVDIETEDSYGMFDSQLDHVVNSGAIDVSGGASLASTTSTSGDAGNVWIWGYNSVTNSGAITAVGGDDPDTNGGTDGYGNRGGYIELYSELGPVENSGALTSDGGDGEYRGGDAEWIGLFGPTVVNSGVLSANGGNADAALAGSVGGDGDDVELFAPGGISDVSNTGSATNAGGTGETAGDDGDYIVGGLLM
ncbi:MAG: hypothetical protein PVG41_02835 [Desulfobacteraceae bacterium]|jgi:hypothetical protein